MGGCVKRIILVISLLACGSLGLVMAQEATSSPPETIQIDTSSPAAQAYLAHETAIINQDYEKAWEMECASLRENRWKNNFEAFKTFYLDHLEKKVEPYENERFLTIHKIETISAKEVWLKVATGQTFVIVYENGRWCFGGLIDDIILWE